MSVQADRPAGLLDENKGAAGSDGVSLRRFAHTLDAQLLALEREARAGTYRPGRYCRITIQMRGKTRPIVILMVRDRVPRLRQLRAR